MIQLVEYFGTFIVLVPGELCSLSGTLHAVYDAANVSKCR